MLQSVTGLIRPQEHNGSTRLVVVPLVDESGKPLAKAAAPFFVHDVPGDIIEELTKGKPVATLTFLRPYDNVENQNFSCFEGMTEFIRLSDEQIKKILISTPAPVVDAPEVAQQTVEEARARKAAAREARASARISTIATKRVEA